MDPINCFHYYQCWKAIHNSKPALSCIRYEQNKNPTSADWMDSNYKQGQIAADFFKLSIRSTDRDSEREFESLRSALSLTGANVSIIH